jgi:hypothetical protein
MFPKGHQDWEGGHEFYVFMLPFYKEIDSFGPKIERERKITLIQQI